MQRALHRIAKPWYRLRAMRVFRDQTNLAANPGLWSSIESALRDSEFFLFMASPAAAQSPWVQKEVDWWLSNRSAQTFLVLLTDGQIAWNQASQDFDWGATTALPVRLSKAFSEEPLYADLRWARTSDQLSVRHSQFRAAILELAATLLKRPKDELDSDDVRQYRRTRRLAWSAVVVLAALTAASLIAARIAIQQRDLAFSRELAAHSTSILPLDPELAILLAREGIQRARTVQAEGALRRALLASPVRIVLGGHRHGLNVARFSPDGSRIITASADKTARIWDAAAGSAVAELQGEDIVNDAAFSPDGKLVVTAGADGTARIWEAAGGKVLKQFRGEGSLRSAQFSPDGGRILLAQGNRMARIWDVAQGKMTVTLSGQAPRSGFEDTHAFAMWSPDGRWIATATDDQVASLWDAASGKRVAELRGHLNLLTGAAFSPDGSLLVTTGRDGASRVWTAPAGRLTANIAHDGPGAAMSAAFSPDGRLVVTGNEDGTAEVWDVRTGSSVSRFRGHDQRVLSAAFSRDGRLVVTAGADGTARVWETRTGRLVDELRGHGYNVDVKSAEFSPDGRSVLTAGWDRTARIWEPGTAREVIVLNGGGRPIIDLGLSPDGSLLFATVAGGGIQVWSAIRGESAAVIPEQTGRGVLRATLSRDGRLLALAGGDAIRVWDLAHRTLRSELRGEPGGGHMALSPDGARLAAVIGEGRTLRLWEVETGASLATLAGHDNSVTHVTFSPDGRTLLTTSEDGTARLWNGATGDLVREIREPNRVNAGRFGSDGRLIVLASDDNTVRVYWAATGTVKVELSGHRAWVKDAAFSADGMRVVTASDDQTARVWEVEAGRLIAELRGGHKYGVKRAAFSPDGRWVVTAGGDRVGRVWDAATGEQVAELSRHPKLVTTALFGPTGPLVITASEDGTIKLHPWEAFAPVDKLIEAAHMRVKRMLDAAERQTYLHESVNE